MRSLMSSMAIAAWKHCSASGRAAGNWEQTVQPIRSKSGSKGFREETSKQVCPNRVQLSHSGRLGSDLAHRAAVRGQER